MTLDGFVAGPNQSVDNPLGIGGERLFDGVGDDLTDSSRCEPLPRRRSRTSSSRGDELDWNARPFFSRSSRYTSMVAAQSGQIPWLNSVVVCREI